ncbi:hypothetical protein N7513_010723 [Penicillium frequentans]|nr:hypothetical protein N7513_010723 [Penicillium glabrum]
MEPLPPLPKVRLSSIHRLNCLIHLCIFKILAVLYFTFRRIYNSTPASRPTFVKCYPCRPSLECRFFIPPTYRSGQNLALYIDIHGGGFAFCDATVDDEFCSSWAARTGMMVASLNYRKAPLHPFPTPTYDLASVIKAILSDVTLPIDHSRIVMGGFSAGGNLALSVSQLPGLKGIVKAVISYYPILDFGQPPNEKLDARPCQDGPRDRLEKSSWWLDWGYVSVGQDRRDPLLSPYYAKQKDLPPNIYMVGAEWDMLRLEAQEMIHYLAGLESKEDHEEPFEEGGYKWTLALGCPHGFTHPNRKRHSEVSRLKREADVIYGEAHQWLKKRVLA